MKKIDYNENNYKKFKNIILKKNIYFKIKIN